MEEKMSSELTQVTHCTKYVNEFLAHGDHTQLDFINTTLATIATFDDSLFSSGRIEVATFFDGLLNLLSRDENINWPVIVVLHNASKNRDVRHALVRTYKILPLLTKFLMKLQSDDQVVQILSFMEELTYDIKIDRRELYINALLKLLSGWIVPNSGGDSTISRRQSLSLTILINLCSKNKNITDLLIKTVNVRELSKYLIGLRADEKFDIQICRLFIALQDVHGSPSAADVHGFLNLSLQKFMKNIKTNDSTALRECCVLIEDMLDDSRTKNHMLGYNKYDEFLGEFLKYSTVILQLTDQIETGLKRNLPLKYTLILLLKFVQLGLYSMKTFYPLMCGICIKSLTIHDCIENALELLTAIINSYSDEGMLPDKIVTVINPDIEYLLDPLLLNVKFCSRQWFKVVLSLGEFSQESIINNMSILHFEECVNNILNTTFVNDTFENNSVQEAILLAFKICLNFSEAKLEWQNYLQKLTNNKLAEKILLICLNSPENVNRKLLSEIIKHPAFSPSRVNQLFTMKMLANADEKTDGFKSNNISMSVSQEYMFDKLVQRIENILDNNQINDITVSSIVELYKYKNSCLEQRLNVAVESAEHASKNIATLNSTLTMLTATNNKQQEILYNTLLEKESLQKNVALLTSQVNDSECALKKFSGKLVAEKMSKEQQIANSQREFMQRMKELEESIELKDNEIRTITFSVQELKSTNTKLTDKLNDQTKKNNELAEVLLKFEDRIRNRDKKLEDTNNKANTMKSDLDQAQITIKTLEKTLQERDKRITQLTSQIEEMQRVQDMIANLMGNRGNQNNSNSTH